MLNHFFAVTLTSLYEVKADLKGVHPRVTKIALIGSSDIPAGYTFEGGTMLAVGSQLIMFTPKGKNRNVFARGSKLGENTDSVVALFKNKARAERCCERPDLQSRDPRWIFETRTVLDEIGENHPQFSIIHGTMAFFPS